MITIINSIQKLFVMIILVFIFPNNIFSSSIDNFESDFLKEYPQLNKHTYKKPNSGIFIGVGITPIGMTDSRFILSGSVFQLHYIKDILDFELFNISFSINNAEKSEYTSYHLIVRTAPKMMINQYLSVGGIAGWEFVSFPDVNKKEYKGEKFTPLEPFSTTGFIFGIIVTQNFKYYEKYRIKISEFLYREFYSVKESTNSWKYWFEDPLIQQDPERNKVAPSFVGGVEISILF
ncbi:hypothetical protein JXR93_03015 [bacterium]|nr:hypothetical protein [bacterium]